MFRHEQPSPTCQNAFAGGQQPSGNPVTTHLAPGGHAPPSERSCGSWMRAAKAGRLTLLKKCSSPSCYRAPMKENLMTVQEVAEHLHLSPHTIYKWVEKGRIPVIRLGYCVRFRPSDITEFEEQRYVPAFGIGRKRSGS